MLATTSTTSSQNYSPSHYSKRNVTFIDLLILGSTVVLGGQVFQWNHGLKAGIWEFFTSTVLTGIAYICLALCIAELTSTLPFSGGIYGYVRVSVNPMWGFLVGIAETFHHLFMMASLLIPLGDLVTIAMQIDKGYNIAVWFIVMSVILAVNMLGGRVFWTSNRIIGVTSIVIIILYIFASTAEVDFPKYAVEGGKMYNYDGNGMFTYFPYSSWFFVGLEVLPLSASLSDQPKVLLPHAIIISAVIAFCTAIIILFMVASQEPGIIMIVEEKFPIVHGFICAFKMSYHNATWLSLPSIFGSIFGFMFASGRQMTAMAHSGLLPAVIQGKEGSTFNSNRALLLAAVIVIVISLWMDYVEHDDVNDIYYWAWLGSYFVYMFTFISFIEMRSKFSILQRHFVNPLGVGSAIVGMCIFSINFISVVGFQGKHTGVMNRVHPILGFGVCAIVGLLWYFIYAKYNQCFSAEEQKIMFSAYIIKANVRGRSKKRLGKHHNTQGHQHHHGSILLRHLSSASKLLHTLSKSTSSNIQTASSSSSLLRLSSKSENNPSVFTRHTLPPLIAEESENNLSKQDSCEIFQEQTAVDVFEGFEPSEEEQQKFIESITARPKVIASLFEKSELWSSNGISNSSGSDRSLSNRSDVRRSISISERIAARFSSRIVRQNSANKDNKIAPICDELDLESILSTKYETQNEEE